MGPRWTTVWHHSLVGGWSWYLQQQKSGIAIGSNHWQPKLPGNLPPQQEHWAGTLEWEKNALTLTNYTQSKKFSTTKFALINM